MSDGGRRCRVRRGQNGENGDLRPAAVKHRTGRLCVGGRGVQTPDVRGATALCHSVPLPPPPEVLPPPRFLLPGLSHSDAAGVSTGFPVCSHPSPVSQPIFQPAHGITTSDPVSSSWLPVSHRRCLSLTLQALWDLAPAFPVQLHLVVLQTPAWLPPPSTPAYPFMFLEGCRTLSFLEPFQCIIV